ncbi:hypothetical protein [Roseiconus lacunae]|uniref:hypothetical protein n=1 Tax=Roseiconus lacunae TaxID=2605694 RepID=UPI001E54A453|nr:hypothetical protein [Roseiconus lacunae]MCD0460066.1 hypothetical protein [Roseiconus lacunae]
MSDVTTELKNAFFDRQKVIGAVDRAARKAMSRSLAFVRRSQRSSIRRRKKVSEPGKPPSSHSSDPVASIKNILFAYDQQTKSGIVGMVKIHGRRTKVASQKELPQLLEEGGDLEITEVSFDGEQWYAPSPRRIRNIRRNSSNAQWRKRRARIRPRPSAGPALEREAEAGNIISPWANVVTG